MLVDHGGRDVVQVRSHSQLCQTHLVASAREVEGASQL